MRRPRFDGLAPFYRWLEWGTYGGLLQWCRTAHLKELGDCRHALVVGDGDGRFLAALLRRNRNLTADSLDASEGMIALARREVARVPGGLARIRFVEGDVRKDSPPAVNYDLIATNFLLDCFPADELSEVVDRLAKTSASESLWVIGDFALPPSGWRRRLARVALAGMYAFFRVVTRIPAGKLVDPAPDLRAAGFQPISCKERLGGFLVSTLWRRKADIL